MNDPQQEIIAKLKDANNILVTVSSNPSVDQLAACIGLTIFLNKLKKHASAVFSGTVPSTIEFLKPEETIEKNTDSLRDFIIALDKSKADKLRYKVEENVVKIFITPYKTSISQDDLDFSQGDFNVDVVLTLGVQEQKDLDQAITTHGRILHDAVVMSVNLQPGSELGTINWTDPAASSLSELSVEIADNLDKTLMDSQVATALLTGIVAETDRFSNEKTSPNTMRLAAELMSAGANQQLVASELQTTQVDNSNDTNGTEPSTSESNSLPPKPKSDDGTLEIAHNPDEGKTEKSAEPAPEPQPKAEPEQREETSADEQSQAPLDADGAAGLLPSHDNDAVLPPSSLASPHRVIEPPSHGGQLTANTEPEREEAEGTSDPLSAPQNDNNLPLLQHDQSASDDATPDMSIPLPEPVEPAQDSPAGDQPSLSPLQPLAPPSDTTMPSLTDVMSTTSSATPQDDQIHIDADGNLQLPGASPISPQPTNDATASTSLPADDSSDQTLSDIEQSVSSPHVNSPDVDAARDAVLNAINSVPPTASTLPPKQDVGASGYLNVQDLPDAEPDLPPAPQQPLPVTDPLAAMPSPSLPDPSAPLAPQPMTPPAPAAMPSPAPAAMPSPQPLNMTNEPAPGISPADTPLTMPLPPTFSMPPANPIPPTSTTTDPSAPPPVPPPMTDLPPFAPPK